MLYQTEQKMLYGHEETLEALEDIEKGRILAGEKVMNWLASWGDKDELELPDASGRRKTHALPIP
jgi:predicted transcriptional regulator